MKNKQLNLTSGPILRTLAELALPIMASSFLSTAYTPLYNGQIQSTGPRYCPSIETKLVTFPDKDQHPLFLEPVLFLYR